MTAKFCCDTDYPHCHCRGDKGHNILPGCPGYVGPNNVVRSIFDKEYWEKFWDEWKLKSGVRP